MKRIISVLAIFALLFTTAFAQTSDWAAEDIKEAEKMNLIPEILSDADLMQSITRAEFAALTVKAYTSISGKEIENKENPFSDTNDENVIKAYSLGIVNGVSENTFSSDSLLTRQQSAAMLARLYNALSGDKEFSYDFKSTAFDDDGEISDYAKKSVYFMYDNKIISGMGDNKFAPQDNTTREQAIVLVKRFAESEIVSKLKDADFNPDPYDAAEQMGLSKDENAYTVAFIGGSLTEGGGYWISKTIELLQEKMPDKKVQYINAGKGGTPSSYGSARFMHDVGAYDPKLVFIEFSVNDSNFSDDITQAYTESMIRMCGKLKSKPSVVLLNAPFPVEMNDDTYKKWESIVKCKDKLAEYYGIEKINVYDYMQRDYEKVKDEKGYNTFTDYLAPMYNKSGSGFDVHGGYEKYAEAIAEKINENFEAFLSKPKDAAVYCKDNSKLVNASYTYIDVNSPRMHYSGQWSTYTKEHPFKDTSSGVSINDKHYIYPYFTNGIKQSLNQASAFGFMTKAEAFCLNFPSASAGLSAKVYIDMAERGTVSCYSSIHGMNYTGEYVGLPNDGKEHKVIVVVDKATDSNYVFRFGGIIERFAK